MRKFCLIIFALVFVFCPKDSWAKYICSFSGKVDLDKGRAEVLMLSQGSGAIRAEFFKNSGKEYSLLMKLEHFSISNFDISSEITGNFSLDEENDLAGELSSRYSLLDYKPVREIAGKFAVAQGRLNLKSFVFGQIKGDGFLGLQAPYQLELNLNFAYLDGNELLDLFVKERNYYSLGELSGKLKISGQLNSMYWQGRVESYNGFIKDVSYDSLRLNVEGLYPNLRVVDSTITSDDGLKFSVEGTLNLRDKQSYLKQIKALTFLPLVQKTSSEAEWTIKSKKEEDSATELKYIRRKSKDSSGDEMDMFGLGRTIKF